MVEKTHMVQWTGKADIYHKWQQMINVYDILEY